ncbi:hypothetical protein ACF1A5_07800 [Streptomyces sp. NPDC014864]|uniref:hypothetical protein n=1 Tax=Streptomyces sp. NPDC014864 TaxID=3364924 RepID=UPI0036FBC218
MGSVLTTASTVTCGHQPKPPDTPAPPPPPGTPPPPVPGLVTTTGGQKLKVGGNPVLVKSSILGAAISNCPNTVSPMKPCTTVRDVLGGEATKLRCGQLPVMLDRIGLSTDGSLQPPNPLTPDAGQSKLLSM